MHLLTFRAASAAALAGSVLLLPLGAQTKPPAPSDDTVTLSAFEVSSKENRGYIASESMTGTRVATKIADLPFAVNVITSEFFEDFALFELNENVAYISSLSNLDQGGGYNLRGFNQSYQLRDGFFRLGRYGTSNVDRIEVIKGPNASIYGQSQPGGMINMISKRPRNKRREDITFNAGSYDTVRVTAEATGPVGLLADTNYIFDYGYYERSYDRPFSMLRNKEYYGAVQHFFAPKTNLLVTAEYFERHQGSPINNIPYRFDPRLQGGQGEYVGVANELADYNQNGPAAYQDRNILFISGIFEHQINQTFSLRLGTNFGHAKNQNFANTNQTQYYIAAAGAIPANSLARPAPSWGLIDENTLNIQADLLADWKLFNGEVKNRDLLTFDLSDYYRFDPTRTLRAGVARGTERIIVGQPVDYYVPPYNLTDYVNGYGVPGNTVGRWRKNRATVWGNLYRHQSTLFSGRLQTYFSIRYDEVKLRLRNSIGVPANAPVTLKDNLQNWSPSGGINVKIVPALAAYVNYSTGFNPLVQNQDAKSPLPAETAKGWDYGFKGSLFQERLNFTIGGYSITRENVVVSVTDAQGNTVNESAGGQRVRGAEFDLNWRVTDSFTVGGSYGYVDSEITNDGFRYMSIGRPAPRLPVNNFGTYAKYDWSAGTLKGLSVNLGVTYAGPSHPENFNAGDVYALDPVTKQQVFVRSNNLWAVEIPGYAVWNAGLRYQIPGANGAKFRHTIGLNVNNLFDRFYISTARTKGDERSFFVNYKISH